MSDCKSDEIQIVSSCMCGIENHDLPSGIDNMCDIERMADRIRTLERERDEARAKYERLETFKGLGLCAACGGKDDMAALAHHNNVLREALGPFAEHKVSSPEFKGDVPTHHKPSAREKVAIDALALTLTQAEREVAAMKDVCEAAVTLIQHYADGTDLTGDLDDVDAALRGLDGAKESE